MFEQTRREMVAEQLVARGIRDPRVLAAMRDVPRHRFVAASQARYAYSDGPLPIGHGQTISQPYIVAFMVEALQLSESDAVLEIGAGCGYAAAVLAELVGEVYGIERLQALADLATQNLSDVGYDNVHIRCSDGTLGWPEHAPFDAILVSAGGPEVPPTLKAQLRIGGRLVIPIGEPAYGQELVRVTRTNETEFSTETLLGVHFVPLIGAEGFHAAVS